ncbi:McrC family protein [Pseudomonas baetica]|uniref:McrC family protein n=1 Tax=Pseudomonas baetica TaxID=674054 RepID=UPI001C8B17C7|nr:McrC family protein [Pseudomonas baetica]MBX9405953.1 McrC family protein [Pseudomonas baetica]
MAYVRTRLSLVEYGSPIDLSHAIGVAIGADRAKANGLLIDAGNRAASSLGLNYNPISVDAQGARAIDFAGLIRLAPSLELEVAPKFLGLDDFDATWREDFFFLSTLSLHGRLLASERLAASGGAPRDLSTLVARSMTSMYEARKRRPLRTYRRVREAEFFLDGDPDPVDLIFPSPDGFEQELVRFDRHNGWNSDITAAARALLTEVSDPSVVGSLVRLIEDLAPQKHTSAGRRRPIPARHRAWRPLHELSVDVLGGLGLNYNQGQAHAPGYVVATWRVWEDLLTVALRLGFGRAAVVPQKGFTLGSKTKVSTGETRMLSVFPDCVIESDGTRPRMLLDAKYKGHAEKGRLRISEADIYESLAFAKAATCNRVVLAYPALPSSKLHAVGTCATFETIQIDAVQIVGVQIESRHISKTGGLKEFALNLAKGVSEAFS